MNVGFSPDSTQARVMSLLPPMGIRNPVGGDPEQREVDLITPHGDQEQDHVQPTLTVGSDLITPHGDQERPAGRTHRLECHRAHYPSWGSGTPGGGSDRRREVSHYPSWGSGTKYSFFQLEGGLWLITPHGDQEPKSAGNTSAPTSNSHYPSWGSGTGSGRKGREQRIRLITPHGDQELRAPAPDPPRGACSLPLMGIRNSPAGRAARRGTSSLPLMGIRNSTNDASRSSSSEILITPHGDQEPETRWEEGRTVVLITPHGDQERRARRRRSDDHPELITPHGDQEPWRAWLMR